MKLPMKQKYVDEAVGVWSSWGTSGPKGTADINDGRKDVFTALPDEAVSLAVSAQSEFRQRLYEIMCGEKPQIQIDARVSVVLQSLVGRLDLIMSMMEEGDDANTPKTEFELESEDLFASMAMAGFFTQTIIKVQKPLSSNVENPPCMVYNEDRSVMFACDMSHGIMDWFEPDDLKIYALCRVWKDGQVQMVRRVEELDW